MTSMTAIAPGATAALRYVAALCDVPTHLLVAEALRARGGAPAVIIEGGIEAAIRLIAETASPDLLLVDIDANTDVAASLDALANVCATETRVIALGSTNDIMLYRCLIDAGIADYLIKPFDTAELTKAIDSTLSAHRGRGARIVAMIGARGGVGTTALALSVGWMLAQQLHQRVVLLDLDLHFGALALGLDVVPGPGLCDLLATPERIDELLIDAALTRVDSKMPGSSALKLLAGEAPLEAEVAATTAGVAALLAALSSSADTIVVELPRHLDDVARSLLRTADCVAIVTDHSLAGLRDTQRLSRLITGLRAGARPWVVANRGGRDSPGYLPRGSFEAAMGKAFDVEIAEDAAAARAAALKSQPLAAGARNTAEWRQLAALLGGFSAVDAPPQHWLQRLVEHLR